MQDPVYQRPNRRLMMAEAPRTLSEIASLSFAMPALSLAPRGDGHPVLVMPGFGAGDRSTGVIRGFLSSLGYRSHTWNLGTNLGPRMNDLRSRLSDRLDEVYTGSGNRRVSIVGWSLGGVYARVLAQLYPHKVRQVITLGSPFAGNPRSTNAYRLVRMVNQRPIEQMPNNNLRLLAAEALTVPSSAIFSKSDGVVPWRIAVQQPSDTAENIEVYTSHVGLGFSAAVLYAVADRLANREDRWKKFVRRGWKQFVYGPAELDADEQDAEAQN